MIVFPNCKINLGLRILRKREDGFHDLETVFYPLPLYDILEIIKDTENSPATSAIFSASGLSLNATPDNLCTKAYQLLKNDFPQLPRIQIHLHKAIPIGAGLGGGSADAAFMLRITNEKFKLGLSQDHLLKYALRLGSDCPFFIINQSCYATGRGEILDPLPLDLSAYKFVIVNPGIHINTAIAFSGIVPTPVEKSVKAIIQQPVETWSDELINDFERSIFKQHPETESIKKHLYEQGAIYASLSGSGSTVYGIFEKNKTISLGLSGHSFVKELVG